MSRSRRIVAATIEIHLHDIWDATDEERDALIAHKVVEAARSLKRILPEALRAAKVDYMEKELERAIRFQKKEMVNG